MKTQKPQSKDELVSRVLNSIENDPAGYAEFARDLMKEALQKRTKTELKEILYGE